MYTRIPRMVSAHSVKVVTGYLPFTGVKGVTGTCDSDLYEDPDSKFTARMQLFSCFSMVGSQSFIHHDLSNF